MIRKLLNLVLIFFVISIVIIGATYVYKTFDWTRIDILNIATLSTTLIAIIALTFNARQFQLNKENNLHERGEFRIKKYYQTKFSRIQPLKVTSIVNEKVVNKGRGFQLTPEIIHILQHHIIEYLINNYGNEISITKIYLSAPLNNSEINKEFLTALHKIFKDISHYSPWIMNYHKKWIDLISEIRLDKRLSNDQKESTITDILQNRILGYNFIINKKQTNNFKLLSAFDSENWKYSPVGYLDFIKPLLPTKEYFLKSLGKYKYLMDEQLHN
jgi:hypothetical protein